MDALRVLAKSNDLNQVILVERNIDEFLQTNAEQLAHALERLRNAIHAEEVANRSGEDWSTARDYVRRLLHKMRQPNRGEQNA
jgi:menaquinone-dependent protoporphyrinogen IX oxidase